MIPYGRQSICEADIEAVVEVLRSDFLTQGPVVPAFEEAVASYCGAKHAVAVNSGTSALHVACLGLGVGSGDIVWTTPISFVASANCAIYCGASVDFVDIDPKTYNLSVDFLREKLEQAKKDKALPKVVIPVHLGGQSCEMEAIHQLGLEYGFKIIEDASHAIGGKYKNEPIGGCRYCDVTVFSFHPVKIITTAEGGMALTNDPVVANQMMRLRSHGITRVASEMTHVPDGPWYYQQIDLGFNYRMTEMQAALGLSQLKRVDEFVTRRHEIARRYNDVFADSKIITPWQHGDAYSSHHLYIIRIRNKAVNYSHRDLFERLRSAGILINLHYIPIYRHPFYERLGFQPQDFKAAESYYSEAISLPIYPTLSDAQQLEIVDRLKKPIGYQTLF